MLAQCAVAADDVAAATADETLHVCIGIPATIVGRKRRITAQCIGECQLVDGRVGTIESVSAIPAEAEVESPAVFAWPFDGARVEGCRRDAVRADAGTTPVGKAITAEVKAPPGNAGVALDKIRGAQLRCQNQSAGGRTRVEREGRREPRRWAIGNVAGENLIQSDGLGDWRGQRRGRQPQPGHRSQYHRTEDRTCFHERFPGWHSKVKSLWLDKQVACHIASAWI